MITEEQIRIGTEAIIKEARSWIGTPYRWNCKVKGARGGVACGDLIEQVYQKAGGLSLGYHIPELFREWHMKPESLTDPHIFENEIKKFTYEIQDWEQRRPADVCMMKWAGRNSHVAILEYDDCIIHAVNERKVMKHRLRSFRANLSGIFRPIDDIFIKIAEGVSKPVSISNVKGA